MPWSTVPVMVPAVVGIVHHQQFKLKAPCIAPVALAPAGFATLMLSKSFAPAAPVVVNVCVVSAQWVVVSSPRASLTVQVSVVPTAFLSTVITGLLVFAAVVRVTWRFEMVHAVGIICCALASVVSRATAASSPQAMKSVVAAAMLAVVPMQKPVSPVVCVVPPFARLTGTVAVATAVTAMLLAFVPFIPPAL